MPDVPSEPPQTVPTTRSPHASGARGDVAMASSAPATQRRPASTVARVPPASWIAMVAVGRPDAAMAAPSPSRSKPSQPSETSRTAPTFGCVHRARIIAKA